MAKDANGLSDPAKPPAEKGGYTSGSRTVSELPPPPRSVVVRADQARARTT
jgi:hypothetical protein